MGILVQKQNGSTRFGSLPTGRRQVLLVDDSRAQRALLRVSLIRWGYTVTEAASGDEALELCQGRAFDIILSDWMMPGLSGLDFCRAFRALPSETYGYFILLTSKSEKEEVALGLEAGADDFLSKPVTPAELRARIRAGERLLKMQRELQDKNQQLAETLGELRTVYDSLDRDLIEARKLQQSLVRDRQMDFGTARITLMLRPSGHVGGDLVGYFPLGPRRIAFFSVDVSGHGVASAMLAARLAGMLSSSSPDGNVALRLTEGARTEAWPPEIVAERLNDLVLNMMQVDQYFTCVYGEADLDTGEVSLVQAGHPHPVLLTASGAVHLVGDGGLPIGLIPGATYERVDLVLAPGDRLLMMSDGLIECRNADGQELGTEGLTDLVVRNLALRGETFLDALQWDAEHFAGNAEFGDDISAILLEFNGSQQG